MNDDLRENPTLLGLAAVAVLAACCIVFAWPARQGEPEPDAQMPRAGAAPTQWVDTGEPGEQMQVEALRELRRDADSRRQTRAQRAAEAAELDALVQRSALEVERARRAAAEFEARLREAPPAAGPTAR